MKEKILHLRKLLSTKKLDGFLVPMRDEFGSEYVPAQYRRLEFISNFNGSAGSAIILKKAAFFTDGRYTLQASKQVDGKIFEIYDLSEKTEIDFLKENSKKSKLRIGYDSSLFSLEQLAKYKTISNIESIECENLVDEIWQNKPDPIASEVFILDKKYSGKTASEKISEITKDLQQDFLILTNPESICWLLNIRAHDLPNTPVKLGYTIVSKKNEVCFYPLQNNLSKKIIGEIYGKLSVKDFSDFFSDLEKLKGKNIAIDLSTAPLKISNILEKNNSKISNIKDPTIIKRAVKNPTEADNFRKAHIKDGVALAKFFEWLEKNLSKNQTEISIAEKLENFRKENENFLYPSFDTIAGYAENGAIIHYHANKKSAKKLQSKNILLLDSGGQYLEGTTDVTRTIALGKITAEQKRNFTLVLKGHISLASAKFPKNTSGAQLDSLARIALWRDEKDYKHGTGHGVGFCLNVHEGPHGISKLYTTPLQAGMVISNEPGFYLKDKYGIRIENLVLVKQSKNPNFLEFETLTMAPIDTKLIDKKLLNADEILWLNNYHKEVYNKISKYLSKPQKIWLKKATKIFKIIKDE